MPFMNASEPYRVLFVCLGNICRSPAAEIIFKKMVKEQGLESLIESDSAGMIGYHRGCPPDARMVQALEKYGYQNPGVKSRPVRKDDLEQFDLVVHASGTEDLPTRTPEKRTFPLYEKCHLRGAGEAPGHVQHGRNTSLGQQYRRQPPE